MAMDKFQLSLIGIGTLGLVALFGYSKWQESRARRHAENVFGADHRDVLLDDLPPRTEPGEAGAARVSFDEVEPSSLPRFDDEPFEAPRAAASRREPAPEPVTMKAGVVRASVVSSGRDFDEVDENDVDDDTPAEPVITVEAAPLLPREVDEHVDCVLRFELASPRSGAEVMGACAKAWPQPVAKLRWYGLPVGSSAWRTLAAGSAGQFTRVVAALQLVSRDGPVAESELERLADGAGAFARQIGAGAPATDPLAATRLALDLDNFCAGVDVMIGVNVIAHETPFAGTKIRGMAEAAGMKLGEDGAYRAYDDDGSELFALSSLEPVKFSAETLRSLQTRGLTLTLDVPRAANGRIAFERMLVLARQLADAFKGRLVDDNQAPLADAALGVIREQIGKFHKQMSERSIPPGSPVALRVFS